MMGIDGGSSLRNAFNAAASALSSSPSRDLYTAKTLYFDAVARNITPTVASTLEKYPDAILWRDEEGLTDLMVAAKSGNAETARLLLAAGAAVNSENQNGSTALMFAAFAGKATVAEVLLKAGADPNHANHAGHMPLMTAAWHGFTNTLKLLLEYKADANARNNSGLSAYDYAKDNDYPEIMDILSTHMNSSVRGDFTASAAPVPANANDVPPDRQAQYDANESALKALENRMRKAGLF